MDGARKAYNIEMLLKRMEREREGGYAWILWSRIKSIIELGFEVTFYGPIPGYYPWSEAQFAVIFFGGEFFDCFSSRVFFSLVKQFNYLVNILYIFDSSENPKNVKRKSSNLWEIH